LELRLAENVGQLNEHTHNEQTSLGSISSLQTQPHPDNRELAISGK
jgi:hypothetical protein